MIIKSFSIKDSIQNLLVSEVELKKLNVLVGISGAGKTTIMAALYTIKGIALGRSSPGDEWSINFIDNYGHDVVWSGRFSDDIDLDSNDNEISELLEEKIVIDGKVVLEKKDDKTIFNDSFLPKIDKYKSNFYILRDNEVLTPLYQSMQSIIMIHNDSKAHMSEVSTPILSEKASKRANDFFKKNKGASIVEYCDKYNDIDCRSKIFYAKKYDRLKFEDFLFVYTSIFSNVKSILTKEIEAVPKKDSSKVHHGFQISLKLVDGTVVKQSNISSGMFKTMMLLSDLMFSSKNTVFLIDEIENSLGVNCLPDIIQEIKAAQFQCVISTHHPKIINDISPSNWLIIHRDSGVIKTSKATDIENSSSRHDKFIQLINSCIFRDEK